MTPISPLYPSSIVPGEFTSVIPFFNAKPLLGLICASVFLGNSIFENLLLY